MKFHRIKALMLKYFYITINRIDRIFDLFYWPLIDLVIWGFTSNFLSQYSNFNFLSLLLGGTILWIFVWRSGQDVAVYVLEDFWSKNLYHLFSSPVKPIEHFASILILGFTRAFITFLILAGLSTLIYSFNIFTTIPLGFLAIAMFLLSLFGWVIGLFVTSLIFRYGKRIQVLAWSFAALLNPFSCVFYPLSSLPNWAQPIAKILPTTYIFEAFRSVLNNTPINYGSLIYSFIVIVILLIASGLFLRSSFDKARETGMIAKSD